MNKTLRHSMRRWAAMATLGVAGLAASAGAQAYSNLYFFGDSLTDTGNIFVLTGGATPNTPYFPGRFSDGPVWAETLAGGLGMPGASTASLQGGSNYAFGGARTSGGSIPSLVAQVGGFTAAAGSQDGGSLFVLVGGGNDMRDARTAFPTMDDAGAAGRAAAAATAAGHLKTSLSLLAADGAQHVLLANLPDLGSTPEAVGLGLVAPSSDASFQFNAQMAGVLAHGAGLGLTMHFIDFAALSAAVRADALGNGGATYGITNVFTPCGSFTGSVGIPCNVSAFSDALHPSAVAHALLGNAAVAVVPEAGTAAMMTGGLGLLAWLTRRRRAAR